MKKFLIAICFCWLFFTVQGNIYSVSRSGVSAMFRFRVNNPVLYRQLLRERIQLKIAVKKIARRFNRCTGHTLGGPLLEAGV